MAFSIIMPIDDNRLEQFLETKRVYDTSPQNKEFLMPTRSLDKVKAFFEANDLMKDVRLFPYKHNYGFNPSMAFNIGIRNATYETIIISSPEVKPKGDILEQLKELVGQNVMCQVFDEDENHSITGALVNSGMRSDSPAMYFLAMFNKYDIEKINGWDEDFMKGYAYEDNDFGERWKRAKLSFVFHDDIQAVHQYHPRGETIAGGAVINQLKYYDNNDKNVIRPKHGLLEE